MTLEITSPSVEEAIDKLASFIYPDPQPDPSKSKEVPKVEPLPF